MDHKRCANCGFLNPPFKFCGECGASLTDGSEIPQPPAVDPAALEATLTHGAERRQLTVLFCDIVDSTAFTERLDPEELRNLLEVYRTCVMEVVFAQNGHIARYFGGRHPRLFRIPRRTRRCCTPRRQSCTRYCRRHGDTQPVSPHHLRA